MTKSAAQQDHEIEVLNQVILAIHRQTTIPRDVIEMWCSLETPPLRADELEKFIEILKAVGFTKAQHLPLTLGIVSLYIAIK